MENIFSRLSLSNNINIKIDSNKYDHIIKISYKSDFPLIETFLNKEDLGNEVGKNYSLNVLYTGGIKTYVKNSSSSNGYTTDIGWGCMIRSSQTLLANALHMLYTRNYKNDNKFIDICTLFKDDYCYPFSIHNITTVGKSKYNVNIGDWFGPSVASQCLQTIIRSSENQFFNSLINECLVSIDSGTIYEDEFEKAIQKKNSNNKESSVLVLLCVRLGIENINEEYYESLLDLFHKKFVDKENNFAFVGIAGGKPFKSLYFFDGDEEKNLIYADPHYVTNYTTIENDDKELLFDFKDNQKLNNTTVPELDPSMCIGFTIKNNTGLQNLKALLKNNKIITFGNKSKELAMLQNLVMDDFI
ncbi:hypothetical protein QEN19_002278 [Hanseniaspora menglaensis]